MNIFPEIVRQPLERCRNVDWYSNRDNYTAAFGAQWETWATTQFDSSTGQDISGTRLRRVLGPLWDLLASRQLLEVGCGSGRFTEILLNRGAWVTAVDYSSAIEVSAAHFSTHPNYRSLGASVYELPFRNEQFDIVVCLGVIQHTPHPTDTLDALWQQVKPGGWLVIDQYRHAMSSWLRTTWAFRGVLKHLPAEAGMRTTDALVGTLLPLHERVAGNRSMERVLNRLSPVTSHYSSLPDLTEDEQVAWARLNTHDNLTDRYKHHTTRRLLEKQLTKLGAINIYTRKLPFTVEAIAKKPGDEDNLSMKFSYA